MPTTQVLPTPDLRLNSEQKKNERLFLLFFFLLNLVQIAFTELTSDEGYYWFYSTHLQWGYYDHPPMVAFLVKLGTAIFPGVLGVRFFNLLFLTVSVYFFFKILPADTRGKTKSFLLLLSAPLLNYLTFLVFPDGPLILFSVLFLFFYKKFLNRQGLLQALFLGLSIALMCYSKYHAVLVVGFSFLAYPKVIRSKWYWLALVVAAILFLPHLYWQYQNGFPTIKYHLSGRTDSFTTEYIGQYLSQQLVALTPGLIIAPFFQRIKNVFERVLLFVIAGTFLFFLFSSFKTFVHFHWTSIAVLPLVYFAVLFYVRGKHNALFNSLVIPFVIIILLARIFLLFDLGIVKATEDVYHGRKQWAKELESIAGTRPVLFPNDLREAPLYSFYTGQTGVTLYNRPEKKSQYEVWNYEDSLQGREVMVVTKYPMQGATETRTSIGQKLYYSILPNFHSYYNGVRMTATVADKGVAESAISGSIILGNNRQSDLRFPVQNGQYTSIIYKIERGKEDAKTGVLKPLYPIYVLKPGEKKPFDFSFSLQGLPKGHYTLYFGLKTTGLPDSYNSDAMPLDVE